MLATFKSAAVSWLGMFPIGRFERAWDWANFSRWCRAHNLHCDFSQRDDRMLHFSNVLQREKLKLVTYLEFGVFRGDSLAWWAGQLCDPACRFVGFDTFFGLPEAWAEGRPAGSFSTSGAIPKINDSRVSFEVGLFQNTLPKFLTSFCRAGRLLVHLDADLYSSTSFALISLGPSLQGGDILMFDEFADPCHEFRAFCDFLNVFRFEFEVVSATRTANKIALRLT
jgi:O-methyltransferase